MKIAAIALAGVLAAGGGYGGHQPEPEGVTNWQLTASATCEGVTFSHPLFTPTKSEVSPEYRVDVDGVLGERTEYQWGADVTVLALDPEVDTTWEIRIFHYNPALKAYQQLGAKKVFSTDCAEPEYVPPVLDCEAWQVPGWLNEHGDPTSCVGDHPCPGHEHDNCPLPPADGEEPVTPDEAAVGPYQTHERILPVTGTDNLWLAPVGAALVLLGITAFFIGRSRRND